MNRLIDVLNRLGLLKRAVAVVDAADGGISSLHKSSASFTMVCYRTEGEHCPFDGGDYFTDPTFAKGSKP